MKKKKIIIGSFVLLLLGAGLVVWLGQQGAKKGGLTYSGTIEAATLSNLSFQVGGRVVKVLVTEGQRVEKDQPLAELDRSEFEAAHEQARATLDRAEKGAAQLAAILEVSRRALPDDVARAEAGLANARDVLTEAQSNRERYDQLYARQVVSKKEWEGVKLNDDTARSRVAEAEAVLRQAKSNLGRIGAMERELEAARAQAAASKAALEQARIQLDRTELRAPFAGIVTSRNIEPGEVVTPTRQAMTLSDLSGVKVKIYVGETEIGQVRPGQKADVKVDSHAGKTFEGTVSFISPEGEFTPKIIQTQKERVKLVYLVEVAVPNPNLELKTGMPADVWIK
ncbi:MAG TPA: efflux RND transporter periplasmic adaptor subunit [Syntrophales bacterium]|nr:efflux RND transporter periplasmic adaptor subunit [Syntrophales bacterium]